MSRYVMDIETNGLLHQMDRVHCVGLLDIDTNRYFGFAPDEIDQALKRMIDADELIMHNGIGFDLPALSLVYPWFNFTGKVTDTLVLSRLIKADLYNDDAKSAVLPEGFLKRLYGSHSLKAWGLRLGNLKGDYDGGWEEFNQEMLEYMEQDCRVTLDLYKLLMSDKDFSERSIQLEHDLAEICYRIGRNGWTFDEKKAGALYAKLAQRRLELENDLGSLFEPWEIRTPFTPKVNNKSRGYVKGELTYKVKEIQFNPNSRKHIAHCLIKKYGWKPKEFTPTGDAKVDENVLIKLHYPEAKKLAEFFLVQKRIAMLAEGNAAWMKLVDSDGKIRHTIISGNCISARASHRSPNLSQVPSTRAVYGRECRDLFTAPKGWTVLGSDLSGLELRALAHYLDDDGEYANQILSGDIHTFNQNAAGLPDRASAKTYIYSLCFGAGDTLIGEIVGGGRKEGQRLKSEFNKNIPAFKRLNDDLKRVYKSKGFITGLDQRKLFVRSEHRLLSQLLQSCGAILCKEWVKLIDSKLKEEGLRSYIMGWIHDEVQMACPNEEEAQYVGNLCKRLAQAAGQNYKLEIPIDAEFNLGNTWSDTH
tara:strand:- start:1020 stop:2786 length:1767 start_codon:yes stop_codon:yes gene_type:complete